MLSAIRNSLGCTLEGRNSIACQSPPARYARPRLEALESRDVPATFWVTNGTDSGPGSLRAAIEATNTGIYLDIPNEIVIADNVSTITLTSSLHTINQSTLVIRPNNMSPSNEVHITPPPFQPFLFHTFRFLTTGLGNQGRFYLHNLDIRHFGSSTDGGAILHLGTLLEVSNCDFTNNWAANGGAIAVTGFDLTIRDNCYFGGQGQFGMIPGGSGNMASGHGGALYFFPNGGTRRLLVQDSDFGERVWFHRNANDALDFGGNTAGGNGGAIYSRTTWITEIYNSVFHVNAAGGFGGGVYQELGNLTMTAPIISTPGGVPFIWVEDNSAPLGGGGIMATQCFTVYIDIDVYGNLSVSGPGDDVYLAVVDQYFVNMERAGEVAFG